MARARLTVPDMTCGHCKAQVTTALEGLDGLTSVQVDLDTKAVEVDYDEARVSLDRIREVLAEEDYPVEAARPM